MIVLVVMMMIVVVPMRMAMVVAVAMTMIVPVSMMRMAKGKHADHVDDKAEEANSQQLTQSLHLAALHQTLDSLVHNLDGDEPTGMILEHNSRGGCNEMRNSPLAKPARVSILPNP